jgi:hypothetical protein
MRRDVRMRHLLRKLRVIVARQRAARQFDPDAACACAGCGMKADPRPTVMGWAWLITPEQDTVPYCPTCAQRDLGLQPPPAAEPRAHSNAA